MNSASADRNLLFGMLALQMDFVDREQLVQAMNAWVLEKSKPLGQILCENGHLAEQQQTVLDALVSEHIKKHGNEPEKSLAAVSTIESVRQALQDVGDRELEQTLASIAPTQDADLYRTQISSLSDSMTGSQRFRVLRLHAKGGLGQVSVAKDAELAREVALKEIQPQFADDPLSRSRFMLEAEITGGLEHPGIVPVYGLGRHADGRPYYAMRFIRGDNLKSAIDRFHKADKSKRDPGERELEFHRLLRRFIDVCNALEYAHSRSVLHRDLKPGNIMLGKYGETMVVDWGMAKVISATSSEASVDMDLTPIAPSITKDVAATSMGSTIGTPSYMSPEQAAGRLDRLGPLSDIYGLGATFFHLLTGAAPFRDRDVGSVLHKVKEGDFQPPREVNPQVPKGLNAICLKAMAKVPEDRYRSAVEMADDLEHWLADEPVSAMSDNWSDRLFRWVRRNRSWALTTVAAMALLAVISVGAAVLVNGARRIAKTERNKATQLAEENQQLADSERTAKEYALNRLRDARESLDFWVTDGSEALKHFPGTQETRERFLRKTADDLNKFSKQETDDLLLEFDRGKALQALGNVRRMLGRREDSQRTYREAISVFESFEDHRDARFEWANCHALLGLLFAESGALDDAAVAYREALERLGTLIDAAPGEREFQEALSANLLNFGLLLGRQGKVSEAQEVLQQSVAVAKGSAEAYPDDPRHQLALSRARLVLGRTLIDGGRLDQAVAPLEAAYNRLELLHTAEPGNREYLETLANTDMARARMQQRKGQVGLQLQSIRSAVERYENLNAVISNWRPYRENLAISRTELGRLLHRVGYTGEAETQLLKAVVLFDDLVTEYQLPTYQEGKAACMDAIGRVFGDLDKSGDAVIVFRGAIKILAELADKHADVPAYRERLAYSPSHLAEELQKLDQLETAQVRMNEAVKAFNALVEAEPDLPRHRQGLALTLARAADLSLAKGDMDTATEALRRARQLWHELVTDSPTAERLNQFAWLLANSVIADLRDVESAIRYAQKAHEKSPENAAYCTTLGVAYYRQQNWEKAARWLREAIRLRDPVIQGHDGLFLAMTLWGRQEGNNDEAEKLFREAVQWIDKNRPGNLQLNRVRDEATRIRLEHQ